MAQSELTLLLKVKDDATKALEKFSGTLDGSFGGVLKAAKFAAAGLVAAGAAAGTFGVLAVKAAADAEKQWAIIGNQIKLAGLDFESTKQKLQEFSTQQQRLTGLSDEYIAGVVGRLLPSVKDFGKATELAKLALDMEVSGMMSAEGATKALSLASAGEIDMLKRYVPELKLASDEQLKNMSAAERSEFAIKALKEQFGGAAEVAGNTFAGQMSRAKESLGNLMETIGNYLLPILAEYLKVINKFIEEALPKWIEKTKEIALTIKDDLVETVKKLIEYYEKFKDFALFVWDSIKNKIMEVWNLISPSLAGLWESLKQLWNSLQELWIALKMLWDLLAPILIPTLQILGALIGITLVASFQILLVILKTAIEILSATIAVIALVIEKVSQLAQWALDLKARWEDFKNFWIGLWESIKSTIGDAVNWMTSKINAVIELAQRATSIVSNIPGAGILKSATGTISGAANWVANKLNVKDAVISPRGDIITTDPMDYLIATKNPGGLAGAGGIIINITGNSFMGDREVARKLGNELVSYLKMNMRL